MEYKETNSRGSLVAEGVGFSYRYNSDEHILEILSARAEEPLLRMRFDTNLSKAPLTFIHDTEKALQICALMFSNNETLDLTELFDNERLVSFLRNSVQLAQYSFDLQNLNFKKFAHSFCKNFDLKGVKIRQISGSKHQSDFYVAKLKTNQNNTAKAISESLPGILSKLSEKTTKDLIVKEYWSVNQDHAYSLLTVSSNLATISRILDPRFSPNRHIAQYSHLKIEELMKIKTQKID